MEMRIYFKHGTVSKFCEIFFFFFWCSILLVVDIDIYLHFDRSTPIIFLDFFTTFFFRYPNFAHSRLFSAWDSFLLAQDELQVLEFPVLACLNRALMHEAQCIARHEI